MKKSLKSLIAAAGLSLAAASAIAAAPSSANAYTGGTIIVGTGPYYSHRRCYRHAVRVPVFRTVHTPWGGWRRVFVGYRTVWQVRCNYHHAPWRRGGIRIRF